MTRITVNPLDPASVRSALRQLRDYRAWLRERQTELVRRLAEAGLETASVRFGDALPGYDGDRTPPELTVEVEGTKARLVASGRTVAFLEFGAGVSHPEHSSGLFRHGTYGHGLGRLRSWRYPDQDGQERETTGNDPAEAMTGAVQTMAEQAARIAREVFAGGRA